VDLYGASSWIVCHVLNQKVLAVVTTNTSKFDYTVVGAAYRLPVPHVTVKVDLNKTLAGVSIFPRGAELSGNLLKITEQKIA